MPKFVAVLLIILPLLLAACNGSQQSEAEETLESTITAMRTAIAIATPTPTPIPIQGTRNISVPAGETGRITIPKIPQTGYLNYSFTSVKTGNESESITVDFSLQDPQGTRVFRADRQTRFQASTPIGTNGNYAFRFDNTGSWFAGKTITIRYIWSPQPLPGYPATPFYDEYQDTARCQEAYRRSTETNPAFLTTSLPNLFSLGNRAFNGDWLTDIFSAAGSPLGANDPQIKAIGQWGCGTE